MNGELEVLPYGYHFLNEEDGKLDLSTTGLPDGIAELKKIITEAFQREREWSAKRELSVN